MAYRNRKRPLSLRQQKFVEQFRITGVAGEAAIRAGYAPANAGKTAWRLRRRRNVAEAIRLGRSADARRAQVARERVLLELARVAFADIGELLDCTGADDIALRPKDQISPHHRAAIAELAPRRFGKGPQLKLHNKSRALDVLARHLGLYDKTPPRTIEAKAWPQANRDARAILVERLKRLAREGGGEREREEHAAASLNAGAPLGIPPTLAAPSLSSPAPLAESLPQVFPSPLAGEGRGGG
jgi:phage terminase small subunit